MRPAVVVAVVIVTAVMSCFVSALYVSKIYEYRWDTMRLTETVTETWSYPLT